jgi:hypothetical protein
MNREELENFKSSGPCMCGGPECWYCNIVGDFKFLWVQRNSECGIYSNQLARCIEIAKALAEKTEDADEWKEMLEKLIVEVQGKKQDEL